MSGVGVEGTRGPLSSKVAKLLPGADAAALNLPFEFHTRPMLVASIAGALFKGSRHTRQENLAALALRHTSFLRSLLRARR